MTEFSENSAGSVRRLSVEDVPGKPRPRPILQENQSQPPTASTQVSSAPDLVSAFKALGYILSARALLLLALIGAFVLAVMATLYQTLPSLEVLIAYAMFTVIPVAYLETRRRPTGP